MSNNKSTALAKPRRGHELIPLWEQADEKEQEHWREVVRGRIEALRAKGVTKGMTLEWRDPEKAAKALFLLASGASKTRTARECGVINLVIDRLRYNNISELAKRREDLAERLMSLSEDMAEVANAKIEQLKDDPEALKQTSLRDVFIGMGIAADHSSRLAGIPTAVVEHRSGPSVEDYQKMIESARQRLKAETQVIDAEVIHDGTKVAEA